MRRALAVMYGFGMAVRNGAYDTGVFRVARLPVPAVSVGNLTVGGSGKTPLVEKVVEHLRARGCRTAVVTRGYGRATRGTFVVSDGVHPVASARDGGDEPVQIASKFPGVVVVADERRTRGARFAVARYGADSIVLDDAYQHRGCGRDLDILVIDASRDILSDRLLPAGRLREPLARLDRAHAIVLTRCGGSDGCDRIASTIRTMTSVPIFRTRFVARQLRRPDSPEVLPLDALDGMAILSFCGIGNPASFQDTLTGLGIAPVGARVFPDHHPYSAADCEALIAEARQKGAHALFTTEKDAVRLAPMRASLARIEVFYPEMTVDFLEGEDAFTGMIDETIVEGRKSR